MCLIVQSKEPKIAEEDIVCYKLVKYWEDADVYVSPLRHFPIASSRKVIGFVQKEDSEYRIYPNIRQELGYNIHNGFLHTFTNLKDVEHILSKINDKSEYRIFKCIIPISTTYYEGTAKSIVNGEPIFNKSFASRELIYKEEILCV